MSGKGGRQVFAMDDFRTEYEKHGVKVTLSFEMVPMTNAFHHASANDNFPERRARRTLANKLPATIGVAAIFIIGSAFF